MNKYVSSRNVFKIIRQLVPFNIVIIQVTLLQLEKQYGKSREAKDFIATLIKGNLVMFKDRLPTSTVDGIYPAPP